MDNYLHKNTDIADIIIQKITENEKERKAIAGVTKLARERAKRPICTTASYATAAST